MAIKTFQIFRAGTHIAMAGQKLSFSEADVAHIANSYNEAVQPAPLVLGHPQNDRPTYGTVKKLFEKSGRLYAIADVGKTLIDLVGAGRYGPVSSKFLPLSGGKWYLQHVGFLGAMAPAVKGMEPLNFSASGGCCFAESHEVTFSEFTNGGVGYTAESGRMAFHHAALALVKATPGLSYAAAASTIDQRTVRQSAPISRPAAPHPRAAFHEATMCFMEAIPEASYFEAITQIQAAGLSL